MSSVKSRKRAKLGPVAERLTILLDVFSPWGGISLTYRQLAAELGASVTEASVKKWPQRKKFPPDVARLIVSRARGRGVIGVTLEWLLWGDGPRPQRTPKPTSDRSTDRSSLLAKGARESLGLPKAPLEPHGRFAAGIAEALQTDLGHNEFGQWSSVEVQHTVIWALKDLARRLRVLRFDMGKTFELTDEWAGKTGLPVRPPERSPAEGGQTSGGA